MNAFELGGPLANSPPHEDAPERTDHRCAAPDADADRDTDHARGDEVEDRAAAPHRAGEQSEYMPANSAAEIPAERTGLADERTPDQDRQRDHGCEEGADHEERGYAVGIEGGRAGDGGGHEGREESDQEPRHERRYDSLGFARASGTAEALVSGGGHLRSHEQDHDTGGSNHGLPTGCSQ